MSDETGELAVQPEPEAPVAADPSGLEQGWWLTVDERTARAAVLQLMREGQPYRDALWARERRNEYWRSGIRGVAVVPDDETDTWHVRVPFSAENAQPAPNLADRLIRRTVATLLQDPPTPECAPNSDSAEERQASELTERVLTVEGSPQHRNDAELARLVLDLAGTYRTAFLYQSYHPTVGGLVPLAIQAAPWAVDPATATLNLDGTPADPEVLRERYVTAQGTLTDDASQARMIWQGGIVERVLRPSQVDLLPRVGITGLADATGCLIYQVLPLAEVIALYFGGVRPEEKRIRELVAYRPDGWERWVPKAQRVLAEQAPKPRPDGTMPDDALVVVGELYLTASPVSAPMGVKLCWSGGDGLLARDTWMLRTPKGVRPLPLPLAACRWRLDTATGDWPGIAGIEDLGPLEEVQAQLFGLVLDYAYQYGRPWPLLPMGTTIQPTDVEARKPLLYNAQVGKPEFAPVPPLPATVQELMAYVEGQQNSESGLEDTARGVDSPSVKSGVHAQAVIEQAQIALMGTQAGLQAFLLRCWANRVALMQAFYDTPRMLEYLGPGGMAQVRAWRGADLLGAADVRIARGTGTMLTRGAKASLAREELQLALQAGDVAAVQRYQRAVTGNTSSLLGQQDDPFRARIERQVSVWRDGARRQWPEPPPPQPQVVGVDAFGQPVVQPVPPADPVAAEAAQVFQPNPTDELPSVAPVRFAVLAEEIASNAFAGADARWQQVLLAEFERMRAAAGIQTLAEQQQMQQQQAPVEPASEPPMREAA